MWFWELMFDVILEVLLSNPYVAIGVLLILLLILAVFFASH